MELTMKQREISQKNKIGNEQKKISSIYYQSMNILNVDKLLNPLFRRSRIK